MELHFGISLEGLAELIEDQRKEGFHPARVLLHPLDHRQALEDYIAKTPGAQKMSDAEAVIARTIFCVAFCDVVPDKDVPRGSAWIQDALPGMQPERVH